MLQEFRIERVFYYAAEGIIAWFPMALMAYCIERGFLNKEGILTMFFGTATLAVLPCWVVWKLVPKPYRITTWVLGLFLTNIIAMLSVAR